MVATVLLLQVVGIQEQPTSQPEVVDEPQPALVLSVPEYIRTYSKYGQRAVCVSRIETGNWTAYWNPIPVGYWGEHAQGYFGWLPSTFNSIALYGTIMDLDAEISAFDRMLDAKRGREFYGISAGIC